MPNTTNLDDLRRECEKVKAPFAWFRVRTGPNPDGELEWLKQVKRPAAPVFQWAPVVLADPAAALISSLFALVEEQDKQYKLLREIGDETIARYEKARLDTETLLNQSIADHKRERAELQTKVEDQAGRIVELEKDAANWEERAGQMQGIIFDLGHDGTGENCQFCGRLIDALAARAQEEKGR